jgi:hypothetical protein
MGEVVPKCGTGGLMKIIVWGEKCVCVRERVEKGYNVLAVLFVVDEFRRVHVRKDALRVHDKLCCRRR